MVAGNGAEYYADGRCTPSGCTMQTRRPYHIAFDKTSGTLVFAEPYSQCVRELIMDDSSGTLITHTQTLAGQCVVTEDGSKL